MNSAPPSTHTHTLETNETESWCPCAQGPRAWGPSSGTLACAVFMAEKASRSEFSPEEVITNGELQMPVE